MKACAWTHLTDNASLAIILGHKRGFLCGSSEGLRERLSPRTFDPTVFFFAFPQG